MHEDAKDFFWSVEFAVTKRQLQSKYSVLANIYPMQTA